MGNGAMTFEPGRAAVIEQPPDISPGEIQRSDPLTIRYRGEVVETELGDLRDSFVAMADAKARDLEWVAHAGPTWQAEPHELPITPADVWADYSAALELDVVQPFDASWKSVYEIMALAAASGLTISRKTAQVQAQRAVAAGRMERQWQMRETTAGPRRMVVYRVVENGEED